MSKVVNFVFFGHIRRILGYAWILVTLHNYSLFSAKLKSHRKAELLILLAESRMMTVNISEKVSERQCTDDVYVVYVCLFITRLSYDKKVFTVVRIFYLITGFIQQLCWHVI